MAATSEEVHFAQHLASNEKRIRDKALSRLQKWIKLRSQSQADEFSDEGMTKLWKGLFYCMWMADKPLVQEELADNIGGLIHAFSKPSQSYLFVGGFFKTMGRNHDHIDKYRIDKFLMLARRFFRESLNYLKRREWQHKHVQKYLEVLRQTVFAQKHDAREMALGFRLHMFDVFLEELARAGDGELPQKRAHNFLEPFYEILTHCRSPMVVEAVRDRIFYELIKLNANGLDADDEDEAEGGDLDDHESEEFIDDEALLDEDAVDSDTGEVAEVSEDEDEERLVKRRKTDNGFIAEEEEDEEEDNDEDVDDDDSNEEDEDVEEYEGDLEEQLVKQREDEAELLLKAVDFDLSAVKASLMEFLKVEGIKSINKKSLHSIVKKIIDFEHGVNPFAVTEEESDSDLELDENELKLAEKRLKLLEKEYAEEAENFLVPDRTEDGNDEENEDFEMVGGEDLDEEFEKTFVEDRSLNQQKKTAGKKASPRKKIQKATKRKMNGSAKKAKKFKTK